MCPVSPPNAQHLNGDCDDDGNGQVADDKNGDTPTKARITPSVARIAKSEASLTHLKRLASVGHQITKFGLIALLVHNSALMWSVDTVHCPLSTGKS